MPAHIRLALPPAVRQRPAARPGRDGRRRVRGQALVEFAMLLPILTALLGATVDLARLYEQRVKLEAATRSAAEWVASDTAVTTSAQAATEARALICAQFNLGPTCTYPSVVVNTYTRSTSNPGTPDFPQVTISLTATQPFSTLFPWPYISTQWRDPYNHGGGPNGTATAYATALTASYKFVILQGR